MYDCIIIGGGPAGLNAALYAARGGLSALVIEQMFEGGQAAKTNEIQNYLGFPGQISGMDFALRCKEHAAQFGVETKYESVTKLTCSASGHTVVTSGGSYNAKTVILAMGASPRKLGLANEEALTGKGVSYCATCDGAFYRGKEVAVIGGGDTAAEDALYLSAICKKVYLIHRRDTLRAAHSLVSRIEQADNIEVRYEAQVTDLLMEDGRLCGIRLSDGTKQAVSGVFVAVGTLPNHALVTDIVELNPDGYIITDANRRTSQAGVYAAGDVIVTPLRQIITAAADGAIAAYSAARYIREEWTGETN